MLNQRPSGQAPVMRATVEAAVRAGRRQRTGCSVQSRCVSVWAGLWSLPEFDSRAAFDAASAVWPGCGEPLPTFKHTLTHLDWTLHPVRWSVPARTAASTMVRITGAWPEGRWFSQDDALAAGLPAPLRKLLLLQPTTPLLRK